MNDKAAPTHPFMVYTLDTEDQQKTLVGGSYDDISAVTIACAVYSAFQRYSPSQWRRLAVFDDTDTPIAFIGAYQAIDG